MKMVKSLLLGAAAGLVAVAGAQAADLPVKAKPAQYVKICSLYGAGFYYMPGTDTCLKVGGWVRAEVNFNANGSFNPYHVEGLDLRSKNDLFWRTRAIMTMDARSQTEYGTLRAYMAGGWDWDNGAGAFPATVYAYRGFIQWAGFTAGRTVSFFDFYVTPAYSNTTNVFGSDTGGGGINLFAYTAQFGNGLSATLAIENPITRRTANGVAAFGAGTATGIGGDAYAGSEMPDLVGNLRIDQAWGSAQIMGAAHQVKTLADTIALPGQDELGWAAGAGVTVNLPMISKGDSISAQFTYAKGAMNYVGSGLSHFLISEGAVGATTAAAAGPMFDAVRIAGGGMDLTEGWSVVAGFQHVWNPKWKTSLYGTYGQINYTDAASIAMYGTTEGDWSMWQVGSRTVWTPVQNLDLSIDVMYNKLNTAFESSVTALGWGAGTVAGTPLDDIGWFQAMFRAQRNFYP